MDKIARPTILRGASLAIMAFMSMTVSRANVVQSTVLLPAAGGMYTLGNVCLSVIDRCAQNVTVSGFDVVTRTVVNGDQLVVVNATWNADVFTENGGFPETFLSNVAFPGTMHFTFLGRDPSVNPLGTFTTILTEFGFQGSFGGNTLSIKQDPSKTSSGTTTILPTSLMPPVTFTVSSSMEIFGLFSFNGSPFMPGPPRTAELTAIPEPGFAVIAGSILAGLIGIASRRRSRR